MQGTVKKTQYLQFNKFINKRPISCQAYVFLINCHRYNSFLSFVLNFCALLTEVTYSYSTVYMSKKSMIYKETRFK